MNGNSPTHEDYRGTITVPQTETPAATLQGGEPNNDVPRFNPHTAPPDPGDYDQIYPLSY